MTKGGYKRTDAVRLICLRLVSDFNSLVLHALYCCLFVLRLTDSVGPGDHAVGARLQIEVEIANQQLALRRHNIDAFKLDMLAFTNLTAAHNLGRLTASTLGVANLIAQLGLCAASLLPLLDERRRIRSGLDCLRRVWRLLSHLKRHIARLLQVRHLLEQFTHSRRVAGDRRQLVAHHHQVAHRRRQLTQVLTVANVVASDLVSRSGRAVANVENEWRQKSAV